MHTPIAKAQPGLTNSVDPLFSLNRSAGPLLS